MNKHILIAGVTAAAVIGLGAGAAQAAVPQPIATWKVTGEALSVTITNPAGAPCIVGEAHGDMANALGIVEAGSTETFTVAAALNPGTYKVFVSGVIGITSVDAIENVTEVTIPAAVTPKPVVVVTTAPKPAPAQVDPVIGWFGLVTL